MKDLNTLTVERAPALDQMQPFLGNWKIEGRNGAAAPQASGANVVGTETYAWLPGEHFLSVNWKMDAEGFLHEGLSVIGFCTEMDSLALRMFDNQGFYRKYRASVENDTLTLTGENERATQRIADGGNTMYTQWEIKTDTMGWQPLCDLTETKVRA